MNIPPYLLAAKVADQPLDYKWDVNIKNRLLTADADSKPALAKALGKISAKAAFAFAVASAEWIVARLSRHTDVADALLRVEAAWAATLDPHYAKLPKPQVANPVKADRAAGPVYYAMLLLSELHERYLAGATSHVYLSALVLGAFAEHVAGRNPVFKRWVPEVLKRAHEQYPKSAKPLAEQPDVARELFASDAPDQATLTSSRTKLLASMKSAENPYLTPALRNG